MERQRGEGIVVQNRKMWIKEKYIGRIGRWRVGDRKKVRRREEEKKTERRDGGRREQEN